MENRCYVIYGSYFKPMKIKGHSNKNNLINHLKLKGYKPKSSLLNCNSKRRLSKRKSKRRLSKRKSKRRLSKRKDGKFMFDSRDIPYLFIDDEESLDLLIEMGNDEEKNYSYDEILKILHKEKQKKKNKMFYNIEEKKTFGSYEPISDVLKRMKDRLNSYITEAENENNALEKLKKTFIKYIRRRNNKISPL
jgi:hypothetical protein